MAVFETYSKRLKRQNRGFPDVYQYDEIPDALRTQIVFLINDVLGSEGSFTNHRHVHGAYNQVVSVLRREYGVFALSNIAGARSVDSFEEISTFVENCETENVLDVVEIVFGYAENHIKGKSYLARLNNTGIVDGAIEELNTRFKEAGVGYQLVDGQIVRVDSELIHEEAVKPALRLLNTKEYAGPHEEFISAYEHYKAENNKEALNECLKAFESTMKAICDKRGWTYGPKDTAKALIDICFEKGLIPTFWQNQFNSLRSLLESSIPTARNKMSGHGQGAKPKEVPDHIVAYMLHMTASTLVFLTTAEKDLP